MIGYITINKEELKVKELGVYQAFYCGVCQDIRENYGHIPRMTLSYEMTFLAMLLSSVYDERPKPEKLSCLMHPVEKRFALRNKYTRYAADICVIAAYHNLMDNWMDDKNKKSLVFAGLIKRANKKAAAKNKEAARAVVRCIKETRKAEKSKDMSLDLASGITGRMLGSIFQYKSDDVWSGELERMGFFLGKFIYLMDAYDDIEDDEKNASYNPFARLSKQENFEEYSKEILTMMAAEAAVSFERLPVIDYVDILGNVLYSGICIKYNIRTKKRKQKQNESI